MSADLLLQRVRKFIFDHLVDHAVPPVVEQVMTAFSLSRDVHHLTMTDAGLLRWEAFFDTAAAIRAHTT